MKETDDDTSAEGVLTENKETCGEAQTYIDKILELYNDLSLRSDLKPCPYINCQFEKLVGLCTTNLSTAGTRKILQNSEIVKIAPHLRNICAIAECHLESHWAEQILAAPNEKGVFKRLTEFPYYENYLGLTRMELSAIYMVTSKLPQKFAFLGSGPLPLTSLCLCEALDAKRLSLQTYLSSWWPPSPTTVVNIDHNPTAISQSRALCKSLGSKVRGMQFVCQEAGRSDYDLRDFDVVYLAALVGTTQKEKEGILISVVGGMREGALLVIRTAHSLRTLLYPDFDATAEAVLTCLEICLVVHPYDNIVNSVILGRVKSRMANGSGPAWNKVRIETQSNWVV